jgi:hypothetical protein
VIHGEETVPKLREDVLPQEPESISGVIGVVTKQQHILWPSVLLQTPAMDDRQNGEVPMWTEDRAEGGTVRELQGRSPGQVESSRSIGIEQAAHEASKRNQECMDGEMRDSHDDASEEIAETQQRPVDIPRHNMGPGNQGCDEKQRVKKNKSKAKQVEGGGAKSCRQLQAPTAGALYRLLEAQQFRCAITGTELTPENMALDHKVSVAEGGEHAMENLQWIMSDVNRMKGTMSQEKFVELCCMVARSSTQRARGAVGTS